MKHSNDFDILRTDKFTSEEKNQMSKNDIKNDNIVGCVISVLCSSLLIFNTHNSKTMLAQFALIAIGAIMIISSISYVKHKKSYLFFLDILISVFLLTTLVCNKQLSASQMDLNYDSYLFYCLLDHCANIAIVGVHSWIICSNNNFLWFLLFNILNCVAVYFSIYWLSILSGAILLVMYFLIKYFAKKGGAFNVTR